MIKKTLVLGGMLLAFFAKSQFDVRVNKDFEYDSGNPQFNPILTPFGIQWSKSITNASGEIITVGHTYVSGQGENIFLEKRDMDGNPIFSINWNSASTSNDYGVDVTEDGSGNIFVCGTTDNGGSTDYDVIIVQFSNTGFYVGSTTYAGPDVKMTLQPLLLLTEPEG